MARKKIVYVIVEGSSDETALGALFSLIYDKNTVHVEITHGDITYTKNVTAGNIIKGFSTDYPLARYGWHLHSR